LTVTAGSGTPFASVQNGDTAFIPGLLTGDPAGPFNSLNTGYWVVLSATSTVLVLGRDPSVPFSGVSEGPITPSTAQQFQVFSSTGVQVGDTVDITAGFAPAAQNAYDITAVNPAWIEFRSTAPLGPQNNVMPGTAGFIIYTSAKRFVLIETDQSIVVRWNGDTGNTNRVDPLLAGDGVTSLNGSQHKFGTVYQLDIMNRSSLRATVVVSSAE
jgi:hypothetical protein